MIFMLFSYFTVILVICLTEMAVDFCVSICGMNFAGSVVKFSHRMNEPLNYC